MCWQFSWLGIEELGLVTLGREDVIKTLIRAMVVIHS